MPCHRTLLESVLGHPVISAVRSALAEGRTDVVLSGLTRTAKALVIAALAHELRRPLVVLTADNEAADQLRDSSFTFLAWLDPETDRAAVSALPAFDGSPYEPRSPHPDILERRAVSLWNLAREQTRVLFVPVAAAFVPLREKPFYASLALELRVGDELNLEDLAEHLTGVGYEPAEPVSTVGQFSVRGGIVDVFPPESDWPHRLEFFGDRVESLREFDPTTQRSRSPADRTLLLPLTETRRSPAFFESIVRVLLARAPAQKARGSEPDWIESCLSPFPGWEFYAPLVEPHPNTVLSLMDRPLLVWDEPLERQKQISRVLDGWAAAYDEVRDSLPPRPRPEEIFLTDSRFLESASGIPMLSLKELTVGAVASPEGATQDHPEEVSLPCPWLIASQPPAKFHGSVKVIVEDVRSRLERREKVVLVLPSGGKTDRIREILTEYEIPFVNVAPLSGDGAPAASGNRLDVPNAVLLAPGAMNEGVVLPDLGLTLLADNDLFGGFDWGARGRRPKSGITTFISDLSDLKVGDCVVHVDHGIGLYQGLRTLEVEGAARDFMLLTYQDGAKLYVPLERLDLVEKYRASGDGAKPQLDKLGGATWERIKKRVKRALRDMAQELLRLYAQRKMGGGAATTPDTPWQKEFEESFEFEETPDQLTALSDIKRDLECPEPMDRLLCGDVGYGKTELAMRAAFKVVQDSRQVALLAPTTVLAFQHYSTFRLRMAPFPIRIEMLSRFRSPAEQKRIVADTEAGKVDILIGTHRLLSKDVRFRDLGLLIVDEEQRFGVAAKEKLKNLRVGVDVLTLSATPIPRTLHMSLGGLRDLSVIETPPRGRLAIQTTVAPFNHGLIQAAILQELERQGQVYFVHNRVESIFSIGALVQRLVPTARLGVAHGQMSELERVMVKFMQGEYDVLVSTALIENGLDIPRANTMIVNHADRFGLADLYQLRGRVGRSDRRAYAYFLIQAEEALTPTAQRRLAALKEFSDLGSVFRLAALDLELRGAGNLLGAEQSGHLNAIGIDLYMKMLEETVEELKGAPAKPEVRTTLNLGLDIKIPDRYIADERQRLRMYKRVSSLSTREARADLEAELLDRYGSIPSSVSNLLDYALLKSAAEELLVQSIERKSDEVWMRFHEQAPVDPVKLKEFLRRHRQAALRPDGVLRFRLAERDGDVLEEVRNVLQELSVGH